MKKNFFWGKFPYGLWRAASGARQAEGLQNFPENQKS